MARCGWDVANVTINAHRVRARAGFVFSLSGQVIIAADGDGSPFDSIAALRVDSDGFMYGASRINGAALCFSQIDSATDWVTPRNNPTVYYVRYSNLVGTLDTSPGAEGTAIALTSDADFQLARTVSGTEQVTLDLEILDTDATTVLAGPTGYTLRVENTT